jgi:pyruvate/2-oxoglutarate dehydrogenase complex dihydrolipoamide acyltransferase (E2) component
MYEMCNGEGAQPGPAASEPTFYGMSKMLNVEQLKEDRALDELAKSGDKKATEKLILRVMAEIEAKEAAAAAAAAAEPAAAAAAEPAAAEAPAAELPAAEPAAEPEEEPPAAAAQERAAEAAAAAAQENEISLAEGDTVEILKERDDGWTIVQKEDGEDGEDGEVGKVPTSYIEAIKTVARYDYVSIPGNTDVSLKAGETVEVLEVLEENDKYWTKVKKVDGTEGFAPTSNIVIKAKALYKFEPAASTV